MCFTLGRLFAISGYFSNVISVHEIYTKGCVGIESSELFSISINTLNNEYLYDFYYKYSIILVVIWWTITFFSVIIITSFIEHEV